MAATNCHVGPEVSRHGAGTVIMQYARRDVMGQPLSKRRELLREHVLPKLGEPVRQCPELNANLADAIASVRAAGLEGLLAKRLDSRYEPGQRAGAWQKMRLNPAQKFVIGGYTVGGKAFDALSLGYFEGERLLYVARTRSSLTPALREQPFKRLRGLEIAECPFANLPEARSGHEARASLRKR